MHEIPAAISTLKILKDLTKTIIDSKATSALREQAIESQSAIIELQTSVMDMQSNYQALLQEKNRLEEQLMEIEDWKTEASKYSLTDIESGVFVYVLNPNEETSDPAHWLCARCYNEKYKSILQRTGADSKGIIFYCQKCGNTLRLHKTPGKSSDPISVG